MLASDPIPRWARADERSALLRRLSIPDANLRRMVAKPLADDSEWTDACVVQVGNVAVRVEAPRIMRACHRFMAMQRDGFLCGMYSLNSLANAFWLTPRDVLGCLTNPRTPIDHELYAERDELFVAALRRGVVLGSLVLDRSQLSTLTADTRIDPAHRCVERAVLAAGGLVVLLTRADRNGGHYVSVIPIEPNRWIVYCTNQVASVWTSLGDALLSLPMHRTVDTSNVALVPLTANVDPVIDAWREYTIDEVIPGRAIHSPTVMPFELHSAAVTLTTRDQAVQLGLVVQRCRFEQDLSFKAEELAKCLVTLGEHSARIHWHSTANYEQRQCLLETPLVLRQLASLLVASLGILFAPTNVVSDRDWLRYVALSHCARRLATRLDIDKRVEYYRVAATIAAIAVTWQRAAGQQRRDLATLYPHVNALCYEANRGSDIFMPTAAPLERPADVAIVDSDERVLRLATSQIADLPPNVSAALSIDSIGRLRQHAFATVLDVCGRVAATDVFRTLYATADDVRVLLSVFAFSQSYTDDKPCDQIIDVERDQWPHLLEWVYVVGVLSASTARGDYRLNLDDRELERRCTLTSFADLARRHETEARGVTGKRTRTE